MRIRLLALVPNALLLVASTSFSQTNFPEIEPNSVKAEATLATGMTANDTLSGICAGTGVVVGDTGLATSDVYRVRTAPLPVGIYKHRLTITTSGAAAHIGTLRGVNQTGTIGVGGTAGTTDTQIQGTSTTTTPPRFNQWYAFGKAEEIYYRVQGTTATTSPYTVTLTTFPVTPTVIAQTFDSGTPITITTIGQTTADTEVFVFDSNLDAIPGYSNDDDGPNGTGGLQSELTRTYAAGTYYVALTSWNSAWNFVSPADDDIFVASPLMDFPGSLVRSGSGTGALDWDFTIAGSSGTWAQTAQLPANSPYEILWFRFTVTASSTPSTPFCSCDGTGAPAPCSNPGTTGRGCGSQLFPGGALLTSTGIASDETVSGSSADTLVLTASEITGPALFIQANGTGLINPFGDGHLCATTGIIRMGVVFPTGSTASYPGGSTAGEIHSVGFASAGQTKHYQAWYRSVPGLCTSGQNYNLTNALSITWQN